MIWDWAWREASSARISRCSRPRADRNPSPAMTTVSSSRLGRTVPAPAPLRPVQHALAEQQDHAQADPVDRLDGQDDQQLVPPGGPDEPDRLPAQPRQPPQGPLDLRRLVDVGPGDAPGGDVLAGGAVAGGWPRRRPPRSWSDCRPPAG